ncbi:MAG: hypothetical protein JSV90_08615 [Methanobacteriota archaeon]|nr:MAG: hypothetical protein JSV90_08615 [Euryarchaeota archaeon]
MEIGHSPQAVPEKTADLARLPSSMGVMLALIPTPSLLSALTIRLMIGDGRAMSSKHYYDVNSIGMALEGEFGEEER